MSVRPGDIVIMTGFTSWQPTVQASFKPPKGDVAVFLLLGNAEKKNPGAFDPEAALRRIGWYPESDFGPVEPSSGSIKDRAAELAASMKVMAALHRGNEDVAAADEFAKGAGLVLELDAERDRLLKILEVDVVDLLEKVAALKGTLEQHGLLADVQAMLERLKPEPELTDEALADREAFSENYGDGNCRCHIDPPCSSCTHPGNPLNQAEDPACWKVQP